MATIETVRGPVAAADLGYTLIHEHVLCDFIGAAETGPQRWDADEVAQVMRPYLDELTTRGVGTFVDCSPAYIGRDPQLLARLSELTGLRIVTNAGWYKAPYLPARAFEMTAEEIAAEWIAETRSGIEGTEIRPGFIKIAVNPGELLPVQRTIVQAAALAHQATGLMVMSHTAEMTAAQMSLDLAEAAGMDVRHYVVAHADQIPDVAAHAALAARGAWVAYDAIGTRPAAEHARMVAEMLERGWGGRLLLSQDAGWYQVGEPHGGTVRPYTALHDAFLPALRATGADEAVIQQLLVENPARALSGAGGRVYAWAASACATLIRSGIQFTVDNLASSHYPQGSASAGPAPITGGSDR